MDHPETPCFSPTSGFHHAHPDRGAGFCTFAGQAIASIKLYRDKGARGAYFDLDGHYGNAIEDCRNYIPDINKAVPPGFNINPQGHNADYLNYLINACAKVEEAILNGDIDYVVWCHGADSHEHDDLGGQVSTEYWVKCAEVFYEWVRAVDIKLDEIGKKPLPLTLALFGGYRSDSYDSVLSLHTKDMVLCLNIVCGHKIDYAADVKPKPKAEYEEDDLSPEEEKVLDFLRQQGNDDYFELDKIPNATEDIITKLLDGNFIEEFEDGSGVGYRYKAD